MLLYHARVLSFPLLEVLNILGTEEGSTTENTIIFLVQLLNYYAIYSTLTLRFVSSDVVLGNQSEPFYLSVSKVRSRATSFFYLSFNDDAPPLTNDIPVLCVALIRGHGICRRVQNWCRLCELSGDYFPL